MRLFVVDTDSQEDPQIFANGKIYDSAEDAEADLNQADWNINNCVLLDADNIEGGNQDSKFGGGKGSLT